MKIPNECTENPDVRVFHQHLNAACPHEHIHIHTHTHTMRQWIDKGKNISQLGAVCCISFSLWLFRFLLSDAVVLVGMIVRCSGEVQNGNDILQEKFQSCSDNHFYRIKSWPTSARHISILREYCGKDSTQTKCLQLMGWERGRKIGVGDRESGRSNQRLNNVGKKVRFWCVSAPACWLYVHVCVLWDEPVFGVCTPRIHLHLNFCIERARYLGNFLHPSDIGRLIRNFRGTLFKFHRFFFSALKPPAFKCGWPRLQFEDQRVFFSQMNQRITNYRLLKLSTLHNRSASSHFLSNRDPASLFTYFYFQWWCTLWSLI